VKLPNAQTRPDGAEIQDELQNLTGGRSVPRVFIGGAFVGGAVRTWMLPLFFFFFFLGLGRSGLWGAKHRGPLQAPSLFGGSA
jgi:hypothetical protein